MPRHLHESTLDAYLTRSLDPSQLQRYDAHVLSCLPCTLTVEREGLAALLDPVKSRIGLTSGGEAADAQVRVEENLAVLP